MVYPEGRVGLLRVVAPNCIVEIDKVCTQPRCPLRDPGAGSAFLCEILVRLLAGEDIEEILHSERAIERQDACSECIERVMWDLKPLLTIAQRDRVVEAGRSHWRRRRRSQLFPS